MTVWVTADGHLGHSNIIGYCNRPFDNVYEMQKEIIDKHNEVVDSDDIVLYLGDFCFGNPQQYLKHMKGRIILIKGNHDRNKYSKFFYRMYKTYPLILGEYRCICAHRPAYPDNPMLPKHIRLANKRRNEIFRRYEYIISAHRHDDALWTDKSLNVGVDMHNFYPISLDAVLTLIKNREKGLADALTNC